ncbi:MAG: zinc ribbon domain-containing protein [Alkalispirochaeta sp.]
MYCERCGVELEPGFSTCPLCGATEHGEDEPDLTEYQLDEPIPVEPVLRRMVRRSITGIGATAAIILLIVDIGIDEAISWSPLAIVPVVAGTAVVVLPLLLRRWLHIFAGSMGVIMVMLALLDLLSDGVLDWFVPVALPITVASGAMVELHRFLLPRLRGVVKGAVILVGLGLLTVVVDATIMLYSQGTVRLTWSQFVLISTVPTAALLVLIHRTVLRYIDLRRRFHI